MSGYPYHNEARQVWTSSPGITMRQPPCIDVDLERYDLFRTKAKMYCKGQDKDLRAVEQRQ